MSSRFRRRAGRGGSSHGGRGDRRRKMFMKLIKDEDATMNSVSDALRFIEGMDSYYQKFELLSVLDDERDCGEKRICDVLSFIDSNVEVETILVPFLLQIINHETRRPLFGQLLNRVLMAIFCVPNFLETLVALNTIEESSERAVKVICSLLTVLARAFVEARSSDPLRTLAEQIRNRPDIPEAETLCTYLFINKKKEPEEQEQYGAQTDTNSEGVACWVTDRIPPGDRHDNDFPNFRDIQLIPTLNELACEKDSWLPLANGKNAVINDPVVRLLDSNFRLLREDAIHSIKTNIDEQTRVWKNARVVDVNCTGAGQRSGRGKIMSSLSFVVQVDPKSKKIDWGYSRALPHSGVVALCKNGVPVRMGTITIREHERKGEWLNSLGGPKIAVTFDSEEDFEQSLQEMSRNMFINEKIAHCLDDVQRGNFMANITTYDLVEASDSFFSYKPILQALQFMEGVPLSDEIVHMRPSGRPEYLPQRMKMPNVKYFNRFECNLDSWSHSAITSNTSLDQSQSEALKHALTSRVALIQGPPGCGKTFIGALIARMIRENCPDIQILCVCYTNHALDQFLEHLLETGEESIVRVGGRSKSEQLKPFQLRELARHKAKLNKDASSRLNRVIAQLHNHHEEIERLIKEINIPFEWTAPSGGAKRLFEEEDEYHEFLSYFTIPLLDGGFEVIGPGNKKLKPDYLFTIWRKGEKYPEWLWDYTGDTLSPRFILFWNSEQTERSEMIEKWRQDVLYDTRIQLNEEVVKFNDLNQEKQEIIREKDISILKDARVIGATTNGAAQNREILSATSADVVIVEEAGEVLEAHVLTSLTEKTDHSSDTKHLILIGDHKQLRPKADNYRLTTVSGGGYNLDCSLFERLSLSQLPSVMLQVQHRMRPSISEFVRIQTYPTLKDHPSVNNYPSVRGISSDVVFIDHNKPEDGSEKRDGDDGHNKTKSNTYEAEMCVEIVRYLLLQGYNQDQIVVLTPYVGQIMKVVKMMKSKMKETTAYISELDLNDMDEEDANEVDVRDKGKGKSIRCASVDNFQGEEADVVVISLVRSNIRGNIGFLKEAQRVNVLLSRARHGLIIVGNASTLQASTKGQEVWRPLLKMLQDNKQIMKGLPTVCQQHPNDDIIELTKPGAFRKLRPNGGCSRPCDVRMSCGHACTQACHSIDKEHKIAPKKCVEPCRRFPPDCNFKHKCTKLCNEECGPCLEIVAPTDLLCGHIFDSPRCHDVRNANAIKQLSKKCKEIISFTFAECGHTEETTCANARSSSPNCPATCGELLECEHPCGNRCGTCKEEHRCIKTCERSLFCGHQCRSKCHLPAPCGPCNQKCQMRCVHSRCTQPCSEPCPSCVENCDWQCDHVGKCPLVCGAPCSRLPCNKRCSKKLSCGHQCPTVCGEPCPSAKFCQQCCSTTKKEHIVDMICFSSFQECDLDEDPIVILPCGHFYTISTFDGHMGLDTVYEKEGDKHVGLKSLMDSSADTKPKGCPDCRIPVHSINRYGRILRLVELRSLERKHLMSIDAELNELEDPEKSKSAKKLNALIRRIRKGPMCRVFEACGGSSDVDVPPPPSRPHIRALQLMAQVYCTKIKAVTDDSYNKAVECFEEALTICDASESNKSGAHIRLNLARCISKWNDITDEIREAKIYPLLDWIINHKVAFPDLKDAASRLKKSVKNNEETIAEVLSAMNKVEGYDYGGSWSSHWYQCPNGHPYFIGECGGAMQRARCIECGEEVGGNSHNLLETNRQAEGMVGRLLNSGSRG